MWWPTEVAYIAREDWRPRWSAPITWFWVRVSAARSGALAALTRQREITEHRYDVAALAIPDSGPELADAALAALLIAAGRDGAWHQGWTDAGTALQARRTTDQLASVFYRYQHRHDQELPLEP
jgi:hypothetical protein